MAGCFSWFGNGLVFPLRLAGFLATLTIGWEALASTNGTSPPIILQHPQSKVVPAGTDVTFSVEATGATPLSYRWRRNGGTITNATGPVLTLLNVQTNQNGLYSVVVSNAYGMRISSNAVLQVVGVGPGSNLPPSVTILSPLNGAHFALGSDVEIRAATTDSDGYANRVEFLVNGTVVGEQTVAPPPAIGQTLTFSFLWTNLPAGSFQLTARTHDDRGAIGVSPLVTVAVEGGTMVAARDDQEDPAVAAGGNSFFAVWADRRYFNSTEYDIFGARISRDGVVLDPTGIPICRLAGRQTSPRVAFNGSEYLVVWADDRNSTEQAQLYQIYGARVTLGGVVRDTNGFRLTSNSVNNLEPALASNGNGYFLVWTDWHRTPDSIADIYGTAISAAGTVANPSGVPLVTGPFWQLMPRIASARGEYLLTFWGDWFTTSTLHGLRLLSDGTAVGGVFPIDGGYAEGDRYGLASNGRDYYVAWGDLRTSAANGGPHIFGTLIRSNGVPLILGGFPVSTNGVYQRRPTVSSDGNSFSVVWQEGVNSEDMTDLYGARVNSNGFGGLRVPISRAPGVQLNPAMVTVTNNTLVVWQDGRSAPDPINPFGDYDIYGAMANAALAVANSNGFLISGMGPEVPPVRDLDFQMTFFGSHAGLTGSLFTAYYTLDGPEEGFYLLPAMRMVADGTGQFYYGTDGPGIRQATRVNALTGEAEPFIFTPVPEDQGWEMGVTYDSLRRRMLLATLGGEGFLYELPDGQTEWRRVASMNNLDVDCLTYHAPLDVLYATKVTQGEGVVIYELSPVGALRKEIRIPDVPFGIEPGLHRSELVSVGEYLMLVLEPEMYNRTDPYMTEARLYLIDPRTGDYWMTFRRVAMPPNWNPVVYFASPANDAEFQPGTDITINLTAYDRDGFVATVEVFANGTSIGQAEAADAGFTLRWSGVEPGDYFLTAVARDNRGAESPSETLHIYVVAPNAPPPRLSLPQLISGAQAQSAFFIDGSGQLFGTGHNDRGQIGDSSGLDVASFKLMARPPGVRFWMGAALQYFRSYALGDDGMIYRWGVQEAGEPGDIDSVGPQPVPLRLPAGVTGWSAVAAGVTHSLALAHNGQLYSWGSFGYGELGYETDHYSPPRRVPLPPGVQSWVSIAAGGSYSLAVANDGRWFAWGRNYEGQLGLGFQSPSVTNPSPVLMPEGVTGWTKVAASGQHTLVLASDGRLYGFGYNPFGIADGGVNPFQNLLRPVMIPFPPGVTRWTDVGVGIYHSVALASDGRLFAWGEANYGQLGLGDLSVNSVNVPTLVPLPPGVTGWRAIAPGFRHTLALSGNCQVYGTGHNAEGELGIGHTNSTFTLVAAPIAHNGCTPSVNFGPTVAILSPEDGTVLAGSNHLLIEARASDPDGTIASLSWYVGTNILGSLVLDPPAPTAQHTFTWSGINVGSYVLTVVAQDNLGLSATSAPVRVMVQSGDPIVTIRATDRFGAEEGMDPVVFTVSRTPVSSPPLLVRLSVVDTSHPNAVSLPVVSIPADAASADYVVTPVDDNVYQGTRTIMAIIESTPEDSTPYVIGQPSRAQATILDNDLPLIPVVTVTASDDEATEGGTNFAAFTVRRDIVTTNSLHVVYSVRGTASNGVDYVALPGYVDIPAGAETATIVVRPIDDEVMEGVETVTIELSGFVVVFGVGFPPTVPYQVGVPGTAGVNILDNDRPIGSPVTLVATGSVWKYLTGVPAPAGWTGPTFDDATWGAGPGQLGYGDGDEATVISFGPDPANRFITAYFRHAFRVPDMPLEDLRMHLLRDDGAIVYLNGVEVFRSNMPPGPPTYTTLASSVTADENAYLEVQLATSLLHSGELNVLAVEVHQANVTSSDLGFDLALGTESVLPSGPDYPSSLNIYAIDPVAAEYGVTGEIEPGAFHITRDGSLRDDLTVNLLIDGDAVPGLDYVRLPSEVVIPAGVSSIILRVEPLKSQEPEPLESVRVTLVRPACQPATSGCYIVGDTNRATVRIKEFAPSWNNPPTARVTSPANFSTFWVGTTVPLVARAEDPDFPYGDLVQVEFVANGRSLGFGGRDSMGYWRLNWPVNQAGEFSIHAVATDWLGLNDSLSTTSALVRVDVVTAVAPACNGSWTNHAEYVRATITYAWRAFRAGLITQEQRRTLIYEAVMSNCGHSPPVPEPLQAHLLPLTPEECRSEGLQLIVTGDVDGPSVIESSPDFRQWTPVCTNSVTVSGREIICPMEGGSRFYRVRLLP